MAFGAHFFAPPLVFTVKSMHAPSPRFKSANVCVSLKNAPPVTAFSCCFAAGMPPRAADKDSFNCLMVLVTNTEISIVCPWRPHAGMVLSAGVAV